MALPRHHHLWCNPRLPPDLYRHPHIFPAQPSPDSNGRKPFHTTLQHRRRHPHHRKRRPHQPQPHQPLRPGHPHLRRHPHQHRAPHRLHRLAKLPHLPRHTRRKHLGPQTVTLSNTGTTIIHIPSLQTTPDFTATSNCTALVPAATCTITVTFTPTATGTRISALEISSDSSTALEFISLIGAASPSTLNLSPAFLDFGTIPLGNSSTLPIQITNNSTTPATFNSLTATGDYTVASGTCPPTGSLCPRRQLHPPSHLHPHPDRHPHRNPQLSTSASALPLIASLTGVGSQPHLQITPATLSFGSIALGSAANLTFTLANTGNAPVNNLALTITGDYAVATPCAVTTLAPGTSCSVTVAFTPTAAGARPGTLTISSSDPNSPAPSLSPAPESSTAASSSPSTAAPPPAPPLRAAHPPTTPSPSPR